ncbi:MAG: hypothetical protein KJ069_09805 [Anaerolineae bacterium]|nr:hypothetical protein [Anaerolineae bacterium]
MTMTNKVSNSDSNTKTWRDLLFILVVGIGLGILGGLVDKQTGTLVGTAVLLSLFGAYNNVLDNNRRLMSGLVAGGVAGAVVGAIAFLLGGIPESILQAALFGMGRGILLGAVVGFITRARPDEGDSVRIALFLVFGSIVVGAILGAGVGLVTGLTMALVSNGWWGAVLALGLGIVVGSYLGSYLQTRQAIISGGVIFGLLALVGTLFQGIMAGLVIGILGGALTPMLVVAAIGFFGGLTSRGLRAGAEEAIEAPAEMIQQGAVSFLAPAILVGIIVGAAAAGEGAMIALAVTLALIGMLLGVIIEIEQQQVNRLTIGRLIEMIMLGSDRWPIVEMVAKLSGVNRRTAVTGAILGLVLGVLGAAIGLLIGWQLMQMFDMLV